MKRLPSTMEMVPFSEPMLRLFSIWNEWIVQAREFAAATACRKHTILGFFSLVMFDEIVGFKWGAGSGQIQRLHLPRPNLIPMQTASEIHSVLLSPGFITDPYPTLRGREATCERHEICRVPAVLQ